MVQARQRNVRAFIFMQGEEEETIAYIQKNFILLKDFLLIFTYPLNDNLLKFLQTQNLNFVEYKNTSKLAQQETSQTQPIQNTQESTQEKTPEIKTLTLHKTIRSGEEIITKGDITIFGRVNSGASIQAQGNVQIFGEINGNVFCNGSYMLLGPTKEGNILFDGEIIDKEKLSSQGYKKIYKKNDTIVVEELL